MRMTPMNSKPMISVTTDTTRSAVPGSVKYTNTADVNVRVVAIRNQARPASGFIGRHQMTGYITAPLGFFEQRDNIFAYLACKGWAAGMEWAACWQL